MIGNDFSRLLGEALDLVRAREVEKARESIERACKEAAKADFAARQDHVTSLTRSIVLAQRQRQQLAQAIAAMPEKDRHYASLRLLDVLACLDHVVAELRQRKRAASRPAH